MSQIKKVASPRKWSAAAKAWLGGRGKLRRTAADLGVLTSTISCWHHGHQRTPDARVEEIIALAGKEGVTLTAADLGRVEK